MKKNFTIKSNMLLKKSIIIFLLITGVSIQGVFAQDDGADLFDLSIEELLGVDEEKEGLNFYGYFNTNLEKVFSEPSIDAITGNTVKEDSPAEWSLPSFHLYGSSKLNDKIDVLFNLANNGGMIEIRNAYGNIKVNEMLQLRFGRIYKRFGLFNEKLDQIPTFLGIEAPELLDGDHLLLPRTTTFMVHGEKALKNSTFYWSLCTGNGEGAGNFEVIPVSWDFRIKGQSILFGTSGHYSSLSDVKATSTANLGGGSPDGGVLPWMAEDQYTIFGAFVEKNFGNLLIKTAYWSAQHDAIRDPASVLAVINATGINDAQRENFLGDNASKANGDLTAADVEQTAKYTISTFYVRLGYNIDSKVGRFIPYVFFDYMDHPETIAKKTWGGDNESGVADDGVFMKPSLGIVYKPSDNVAIKLDASTHSQKFNGATENYPEVRFDISYAFK